MIRVLGLPLKTAVERLQADGQTIVLVEVRSRKGSRGADARVIKTEPALNGTIVYWSRFSTTTEA